MLNKALQFKKTGLCFSDIKLQEILTCLTDTYAAREILGQHTIDINGNKIYLNITYTHNKLLHEGLLTLKIYNELKDIKDDLELGTIRFCIHRDSIFIGNIQTDDNQERLRFLSKTKYKTKILNLLFKGFKFFLMQSFFKNVYCTTTNTRCVSSDDISHKLITDYNELFKSLGGVLENNRWRFTL